MKVSVIIPVYNGEKFINDCLDCVTRQTLEDLDILFVDDGSTDGTPERIRARAAEDPRITYIRQENAGCGVARNNALARAAGEYVVFWDCDDLFDPRALELMSAAMEQHGADVCVCGVNKFYPDGKVLPSPGNPSLEGISDPASFSRETDGDRILNFTSVTNVNKMYRTSFLREKGLKFSDAPNAEDVGFTCGALCLAGRVTCLKERLATYRVFQAQSLVGRKNLYPRVGVQQWAETADELKRLGAYPERSFPGKAVTALTYELQNMRGRKAFDEAFACLKENLERLGLDGEEYASEHVALYARHMREDTAEEFHSFLSAENYLRADEFRARSVKDRAEASRLRGKVRKQGKKLSRLKEKAQKLERDNARYRKMIRKLRGRLEAAAETGSKED